MPRRFSDPALLCPKQNVQTNPFSSRLCIYVQQRIDSEVHLI